MKKTEVFAPTLESIIRIAGTRDKPADNITIRGIDLSVTNTPLTAGGFGAGKFGGAITVSHAENCRLAGLEIVNVGGQGIRASGKDVRIEGCHVHHVGACGVKFRGDGILVADNHIHDVGLTYPSAIGLWGGGKNSRITHNEIHDTPYTAVNCGGQSNHIENNLIYRAMLKLHDGAGIYCFAGKDLVLRANFIRDIIDTGGYGASAYYLDERSANCLVERNLSLNVARPCHNHMAKNNAIRNNVFVCSGDARLTFPRSSGFTFEKNVIHAGGKIIFDNCEAMTIFRHNVVFSGQGKVQCHKLDRYNRTGSYLLEAESPNVVTDPELTEFEKGRVRFGSASPARKLGIEPIDVSRAGPRPRAGH